MDTYSDMNAGRTGDGLMLSVLVSIGGSAGWAACAAACCCTAHATAVTAWIQHVRLVVLIHRQTRRETLRLQCLSTSMSNITTCDVHTSLGN